MTWNKTHSKATDTTAGAGVTSRMIKSEHCSITKWDIVVANLNCVAAIWWKRACHFIEREIVCFGDYGITESFCSALQYL